MRNLLVVAAVLMAVLLAFVVLRSPSRSPLDTTNEPVAPAEPDPEAALEPEGAGRSAKGEDAQDGSSAQPGASVAPVDAALGFAIHGRVTDASTGSPLTEETAVELTDEDAMLARVPVDATGEYHFDALAPGRYWIGVWPHGYRRGHADATLDAVSPSAQRDFALVPASALDVYATTTDGRPLAELFSRPEHLSVLLPIATREPPGERFTEIEGALENPFGSGRFQPESSAPGQLGRLELDEGPPVYVSLVNYHLVLSTQRVEADQREVRFVLPADDFLSRRAGLRARLLEAESGAPLQQLGLVLDSALASMRVPASDEDGRVEMTDLDPGQYILRATPDGLEGLRIETFLEPGKITDLGTFRLGLPVWISGRINPAPPAGAVLHCWRVASNGMAERDPYFGYGVEADGSFLITGLSRQSHVLTLDTSDPQPDGTRADELVLPPQLVSTRDGPVEQLELQRVPFGTLALWIANGFEDDLSYHILDERGLEVLRRPVWTPGPQRELLAPGAYELELYDQHEQRMSGHPFTIATGVNRLAIER